MGDWHPDRLAVVIPARDEAATLAACLRSVTAAANAVALPVEVIVVADRCGDATAELARSLGATVLEIAAGNVGRARAAGCDHALRENPDSWWLANTDADSIVPPGWLVGQVRHAVDGVDVVAGTVVVDEWSAWPADLPPRYERLYQEAQLLGGHHVHGANLGLSGRAYQKIGGFPAVAVGEDRALVAAALSAGLSVRYPTDLAVTTSARPKARVEGGGFHRFLHNLARSGAPTDRAS